MKFIAIVALIASSQAITITKFGDTAFCQYELNEHGSCAPMGTNPESCRVPNNIPNNSDCSAFIDESTPSKPVATAQKKKDDNKQVDEGPEKGDAKECEYKLNNDKTACELKPKMEGCKSPAVLPTTPECKDQE